MKKNTLYFILSVFALLTCYYFYSNKNSNIQNEMIADTKTASTTKKSFDINPKNIVKPKPDNNFRVFANRITIRKAMKRDAKCEFELNDLQPDSVDDNYIPEECLGEFKNFYSAFKDQCTKDSSDATCLQSSMIEKALVVLDYTNRFGLEKDAPVTVRALRLFALSLTGNDNRKIIEEADELLSIDPTLTKVRDLKIIAMFGDAASDGLDPKEIQSIADETSKIYEYTDQNLENAYVTDFLLKISSNESPLDILSKMKQSSVSGYPYYLEAAWFKKTGDIEGMFRSLDEALQREPENIDFKKAKDMLTHSDSPLNVQGVFNVSLNHGRII